MDLRERRAGGGQATHRHPWERRRAAFFASIAAEVPLPAQPRWLDAGAGDGWLATTLRREVAPAAELFCWDAHYSADERAELEAGHPDARFVDRAPDGPFDLVTAFDVLEHVEDDVAFVDALFARLRPGGTLLVSVPAWPLLYGPHDEVLAHHRRYRPAQARALVERAGFVIQRGGGLFHSLLPVRVLQRLAMRARPPSMSTVPALQWTWSELPTRAVLAGLALDNGVSTLASRLQLDLPGLTWWAVCVRPS